MFPLWESVISFPLFLFHWGVCKICISRLNYSSRLDIESGVCSLRSKCLRRASRTLWLSIPMWAATWRSRLWTVCLCGQVSGAWWRCGRLHFENTSSLDLHLGSAWFAKRSQVISTSVVCACMLPTKIVYKEAFPFHIIFEFCMCATEP